MGVPLLLTWLRRRFASCFKPATRQERSSYLEYLNRSRSSNGEWNNLKRHNNIDNTIYCDNLYIDLNALLYQAASLVAQREFVYSTRSNVEDAVLYKLLEILDDIILKLVHPLGLVYIAVDGIAPLGKLAQQRARRKKYNRQYANKKRNYNSYHHEHEHRSYEYNSNNNNSSNNDDDDYRSQTKGGTFAELWDGNCISVGTVFMSKVMTVLHSYAVSKVEYINQQRLHEHINDMKHVVAREELEAQKLTGNQEELEEEPIQQWKEVSDQKCLLPFRSLAIVIDDVIRPGEGENKIIDCIRTQRMKESYNPHTCHVICSSDTDVTMSALLLHEPHVYILRYEPPPSLGGKEMKYMPVHKRSLSFSSPSQSWQHEHEHKQERQQRQQQQEEKEEEEGQGRSNSYNHGSSNNNNASNMQMIDNWLSTFFSIGEFRNKLRVILGFDMDEILPIPVITNTSNDDVDDDQRKVSDDKKSDEFVSSEQNTLISFSSSDKQNRNGRININCNNNSNNNDSEHFERALHDVVFVLLLFGNDFLPSLSGTIQEGTLDTLLSVLATEFVSRHKYVVNAETNLIDFAAARYLLECLRDIRNSNGLDGVNDGLQVYTNVTDTTTTTATTANADNNNNVDEVLDWGFEDDSAFQARRNAARAEMASKCYSYWTMLQWALIYNTTGNVEHWNCYYPYSTAPSLQNLQEHCGLLSYDALIEHSQRQVNINNSLRTSNNSNNNMMLKVDTSGTILSSPFPSIEHEEVTNGNESKVASPLTRNIPTDVLTQLLVLLPAHSTHLLPRIIQQTYNEVAESVQAPMESLNLAAISEWCKTKEDVLSGADRLRFVAYRYFAEHNNILSFFTTNNNNNKEFCNGEDKNNYAMYNNELVFVAYWPIDLITNELAEVRCKYKQELKSKTMNMSKESQNRSKTLASNFFSSSLLSSAESSMPKFSASMLFSKKVTDITSSSSSSAAASSAAARRTIKSETVNGEKETLELYTNKDNYNDGDNNDDIKGNLHDKEQEACGVETINVTIMHDSCKCYRFTVTPVQSLHNAELTATFGELRANRFYFPQLHSNAVVESITSRIVLTALSSSSYSNINNNSNNNNKKSTTRLHWALGTANEYCTCSGNTNDNSNNDSKSKEADRSVHKNYIINLLPHALDVMQKSTSIHVNQVESNKTHKREREKDDNNNNNDDDIGNDDNKLYGDSLTYNKNVPKENTRNNNSDRPVSIEERMKALKAKFALHKKTAL